MAITLWGIIITFDDNVYQNKAVNFSLSPDKIIQRDWNFYVTYVKMQLNHFHVFSLQPIRTLFLDSAFVMHQQIALACNSITLQ